MVDLVLVYFEGVLLIIVYGGYLICLVVEIWFEGGIIMGLILMGDFNEIIIFEIMNVLFFV